MTTLADLVNDIATYLYDYGVERDKETSLAHTISDTSSTSITVADAAQVDRGIVEIDDEIMGVASVAKSSGTVNLHPWGRGIQGTTAAIHSNGARVVSNPKFPRSRIKSTINQILNDLYPELWGIGVDLTNTSRASKITYPVNANAESIISISVQSLGPSGMWTPISRWRPDNTAAVSAFSTGRSVDIYQGMPPGRQIKILYRTRFLPFTSDTQTFADVGLDENYRDIIGLGVESKMIAPADNARLAIGNIESRAQAQYVQAGTATQVSRQLYLQYQQRISEEKNRLLRLYPSGIVRSS